MGIFFFLVGLEIERELILGELSSLGKAALPCIAPAGGMLTPALVYIAIIAGDWVAWRVPGDSRGRQHAFVQAC